MDFYVIPPNKHLNLMDSGDRYFCLAQQYEKDEKYRDFFKKKVKEGKWVTLDCGTGDGDPITNERLLEVARDLRPSEVIPLDVLFDSYRTLKNLDWFISEIAKHIELKDTQVLACPQGDSFNQWIYTYLMMIENEKVSTIGFSKIAVPFVVSKSRGDKNIARDRNMLYSYLKISKQIIKPIHFLGSGEPWEFNLYKTDPLCRSTDSCFSIWGGMNGQLFDDPSYKRIPTPKDYFQREIFQRQLPAIHSNINHLKKLLK